MHNVIILGSGRSGTSLIASLLQSNPGIFFGHELIGPEPANPFGYYEDRIINWINDEIIARCVRSFRDKQIAPSKRPAAHTDARAYWLAAPRKLPQTPKFPAKITRLIEMYLHHQPFCYKDPRFSVTLPTWQKYLSGGTRYIVAFRDPHRTTDSALRDASESYDPPLKIDAAWAMTAWVRNYSRLLDAWSDQHNWLFVDYQQLVAGEVTAALGRFVQGTVDAHRIDPSVSRAAKDRRYDTPDTAAAEALYDRLASRARADLQRLAST